MLIFLPSAASGKHRQARLPLSPLIIFIAVDENRLSVP